MGGGGETLSGGHGTCVQGKGFSTMQTIEDRGRTEVGPEQGEKEEGPRRKSEMSFRLRTVEAEQGDRKGGRKRSEIERDDTLGTSG